MAFAQQLCDSALGRDRLFDRQRVIGAIGVHFARRIGDDRRRDRDIGLIGRSGLNGADEAGVLVGGNMRLIAMRGRAALVPCPSRVPIVLLAEPITVASISVPLRTAAPFFSRSRAMAVNRL
jgi:hypothetical protein